MRIIPGGVVQLKGQRHAFVVLLLFASGLAGCTTGPDPTETTATPDGVAPFDPSQDPGATEEPPWREARADQPAAIKGQLYDCIAVGAWHPGSSAIWRPPTPPEWDATINAAAYRIGLRILRCVHATIDGSERPDVWIALEFHSAINDPDSCRDYDGRSDSAASLLTIATSDILVAEWLGANLDTTVHVGDFNLSGAVGAPPANAMLSMRIEKELAFAVQFDAGTTNQNPIGGSWTDRLAVEGETDGFALLDFDWEVLRARQDDAIEWQAESHPPFALGTKHPSTGAMTGEVYDLTDVGIEIHRFADSTCLDQH